MEYYSDKVYPTCTLVPLICDVSLFKSRLLRLAAFLTASLLSLKDSVHLFRKLLAALCFISLVDCIDSTLVILELHVVFRAIIPVKEGKSDQDAHIKNTGQS